MNYRITKGLDLKIAGAADDNPLPLMPSAHVYVRPSDFRWLTPKLLVQQGDAVQVGTPLFCDKKIAKTDDFEQHINKYNVVIADLI